MPTTRTEGSSIPGAPEAVERPEHQTVSGLVRMHVSEGNVILVSFFFFFSPPPPFRQQLLGCHPHHHDQAAKNYEAPPQA